MTSQWSSIESWRNEIKDEDKRLLGAAIGSLKTHPSSYAELKKSASNTRGSSIGNYQITYENRVLLLILFPFETNTPPCYMYFNKNMIVGVLLDRLCQMVEISIENSLPLNSPKRPQLVRVKSHQIMNTNSTLLSENMDVHEEVALTLGGILSDFYPKPVKKISEKPLPTVTVVEDVTVLQESESLPEVNDCVDDVMEGSPSSPPGDIFLSDFKFKNKKLQPLGDKSIPGPKRIQLAVFFNIEGMAPTAIYTFYSQDWVAGRCCDTSMTLAEISNPNLKITDSSKKLVIYNMRTRKLMPSSVKLADCATSGDPVLISVAGGIPKWMAEESLKYTSPTKEFEKTAKRKARDCIVM